MFSIIIMSLVTYVILQSKKKLSYHISTSIASSCFELVHFDLWGLFSVPSIHGRKYFLTIADDHSMYCWVFSLKFKSEVSSSVQHFIIFA